MFLFRCQPAMAAKGGIVAVQDLPVFSGWRRDSVVRSGLQGMEVKHEDQPMALESQHLMRVVLEQMVGPGGLHEAVFFFQRQHGPVE